MHQIKPVLFAELMLRLVSEACWELNEKVPVALVYSLHWPQLWWGHSGGCFYPSALRKRKERDLNLSTERVKDKLQINVRDQRQCRVDKRWHYHAAKHHVQIMTAHCCEWRRSMRRPAEKQTTGKCQSKRDFPCPAWHNRLLKASRFIGLPYSMYRKCSCVISD